MLSAFTVKYFPALSRKSASSNWRVAALLQVKNAPRTKAITYLCNPSLGPLIPLSVLTYQSCQYFSSYLIISHAAATWMLREYKTLSEYCRQRGIYKTLMVRRTIKAGLLGKPHTKRHQCVVGGCVAPDQTNVPFVRRQRISGRRRPSTRGATAPQRAQLVNLVV